jgi:type II secretory pathway predicted ATPase ExeA
MYEAFYRLKERPFSNLPDPEYLYFGQHHSLVYSILDCGVTQHTGFTVVTGEIGCGKTTLIRHLLNHLSNEVTVGLISNTLIAQGELLQWILLALDLSYREKSYSELYNDLTRYLKDQYSRGRHTVLIIDEAQNLGIETLEELRMLSNINADNDQLLQLILVGQPQLQEVLRRPELAPLAQRVAFDIHIPPLSTEEVGEYIRHRLSVAGRVDLLFDEEAVSLIGQASGGVPRAINILCDKALVYGFADGAERISAETIQLVLKDRAEYGALADPMFRSETPARSKERQVYGAETDKEIVESNNTILNWVRKNILTHTATK